jgi:predicted SnoaL-like aldol condensation-catalyzing enzyme
MSLQANKALVRRSYGTYASGDLDVLDDVLSADYIDHNPVPGQGAGIGGVKEKVRATREALGQISVRFDDQVAEGDLVASRITFTVGGGEATIPLIAICRVVDRHIVAEWGIADTSAVAG